MCVLLSTCWLLGLLARSIPSQYYELVGDWHTSASEHHAAILAALVDRDPERAREQMEQHLRASGEAAVEFLRSRGFWGGNPHGPPSGSAVGVPSGDPPRAGQAGTAERTGAEERP